MTTTYAEKLKHPKWQKKRLEVLQRADFKCEACGADDKTLHVHHGYYEKNHEPWDYEDSAFHALCEFCHEQAEGMRKILPQMFGRMRFDDQRTVYGFALMVMRAKIRPESAFRRSADNISRVVQIMADLQDAIAAIIVDLKVCTVCESKERVENRGLVTLCGDCRAEIGVVDGEMTAAENS